MLLCAALLLSALTSEAQYQLARRGYVVQFDSAVVVNLPTYRAESQMIRLTDSLLLQYKQQVRTFDAIQQASDKRITDLQATIALQKTMLQDKEKVSQEISKGLQEIKAGLPKQRWFENPYLLGGVGVIVGVLIAK